ncbi:hypothetical protein [Tenacibaculum sp. 190524A02b]|uniref:Uncharacterized protein n=1 Tax=Tenacibaculum vairaonense TaxID=3137860 RepID=A0ABP1FBV5_9FLAO
MKTLISELFFNANLCAKPNEILQDLNFEFSHHSSEMIGNPHHSYTVNLLKHPIIKTLKKGELRVNFDEVNNTYSFLELVLVIEFNTIQDLSNEYTTLSENLKSKPIKFSEETTQSANLITFLVNKENNTAVSLFAQKTNTPLLTITYSRNH